MSLLGGRICFSRKCNSSNAKTSVIAGSNRIGSLNCSLIITVTVQEIYKVVFCQPINLLYQGLYQYSIWLTFLSRFYCPSSECCLASIGR